MLLMCRFKVAVVCLCLLFAVGAPSRPQDVDASTTPTFKTLHSFNGADGASPSASLVQGSDGNFYGTTANGGASTACAGGCGTVFKISTTGTLTTLHSFDSTDGECPEAALVQATNGDFYATTEVGGTASSCSGTCGTVFNMTPSGALKTLHDFDGTDGGFPFSRLVQATDGNLYGTTAVGGTQNDGTVFKISTTGSLTTLHSFDGSDGYFPEAAPIQAMDGNFYGTTYEGGSNGSGTVFKMVPSGKLTTLHDFNNYDGPASELTQAGSGNLYGTTYEGGAYGHGTVFEIALSGKLTTLYSFCAKSGCTDGSGPAAELVLATDGNFYGTTLAGGSNNRGTIFQITASGRVTTLHSFCAAKNCADGIQPNGLLQATDGNFYGTTYFGGVSGNCDDPDGCGTIFAFSMGLGPFLETRPTSGAVGTTVTILGNNLTKATSVTFNGTPAKFKAAASEITTTVPTNATTGEVEVKIGSQTLSSNVPFRVLPSISSFSPADGPSGTSVIITGEAFAGATSVTFGGVNATTFTVDSDSKINADVPKGAKTGKIVVITPGGTATSAQSFTVN